MQVGPYVLERVLGRGGMGTVHKARHALLGTNVALKELTHADPAARALFLDEARLLFGMKHASFPTVLDFLEEGSRTFVVMDFVDGPTLKDVVATKTLSAAEAALVGTALCKALAHLHQKGILHRDVKPENILLPCGLAAPVLVDFGIASQGSLQGPLAYTPGMAPPEQVLGQRCGPWTDVYQVGATLYCCITGHAPPDSTSRRTSADFGPHALQFSSCPAPLHHAVAWALELDAAKRPATAQALGDALERTLGNPQVAAAPVVPLRRSPMDIRR